MVDIGLLLPHFGSLASRERLIRVARLVDASGLTSIWCRDGIGPQVANLEGSDGTFLDPLAVLSMMAGVTSRVMLGTATLIPIRHPLVAAQQFSSLATLAGAGRIMLGLGAGGPRSRSAMVATNEFPFGERFEAVDETAAILRLAMGGKEFSYSGKIYSFDKVRIDPPLSRRTTLLYGGSSEASVHRAVRIADGWIPGLCPIQVFRRRVSLLRELTRTQSDRRMVVGIIPFFAVADSTDEAISMLPVSDLLAEAESRTAWEGSYGELGDLEGMLVVGRPEQCADTILRLGEAGADHVVLDLRLHRDDFEDQVMRIVHDVVPRVLSHTDSGDDE